MDLRLRCIDRALTGVIKIELVAVEGAEKVKKLWNELYRGGESGEACAAWLRWCGKREGSHAVSFRWI
jgi:hypothetical protein